MLHYPSKNETGPYRPANLYSRDNAERDLQNQPTRPLHVKMKADHRESIRRSVAAHRAKQASAGLVPVNAYIPSELIEQIDQLKKERGVSSRAPLIEEAVRFYIEHNRA